MYILKVRKGPEAEIQTGALPNSARHGEAARHRRPDVSAIACACLNSILLLPTAVSAEPYDLQLGSKIDTYLSEQGSPIAGNGAVFFSSGVQFDVDPHLIVAISGQESHFGRDLGQPRAACSARSSNAWSWFFGRSRMCRDSNFTSFADGIQRVTSGIRRLYLDQGAHTIPEILALWKLGCEYHKLLYSTGWGHF
jgi:hypothetical protein